MECPTKILSDEHQNILKAIRLLANKTSAEARNTDKKFFEEIIEFIILYADRIHHGKEEDILFPALCQNPNMHCDPTMQMRYEHDEGRKFVRGMAEGLATGSLAEVYANAQSYARLLEDHIYKEENMLFPMAEDAMDESAKKTIVEKFQAHADTHKTENQRLLEILKKLET